MRDKTVMMARIKNEGRWIKRCLDRTYQLCETIVIWDDGSTDNTYDQCLASLGQIETLSDNGWGVVATGKNDGETRIIHFINSPFREVVRESQRVNEIRDKNMLWYYVKSKTAFRHVLCLDGDEMPSLDMIRKWPTAIGMLEGGVDILDIPFVYLWDAENVARVDGIYGKAPDGFSILRFPRLFTIDRLTELDLFDTKFAWFGTKGGFHCGSIPREGFRPGGRVPVTKLLGTSIVHFGYIDNDLRHRKFEFYNKIDPNNEFEGYYKHIIGESNRHAPGPVKLETWQDI